MANLNRKQKTIVKIGLVLIILSFLMPRWELKTPNGNVLDTRYEVILGPPKRGNQEYVIDTQQLLIQFGIIVLLTAGGAMVSKS